MILDVDTGVDDALALLYAAATPGVELIGATAVMGNVTVDTAVTNTLAVLALVGSPQVEVARGASRPLIRDHEPFPVVHGELGLGDAELPEATTAVSSRSAATLIVETARARPGEVVLVATGPLTNVALAAGRGAAPCPSCCAASRSWVARTLEEATPRRPPKPTRGSTPMPPRPCSEGSPDGPRPSCLVASGWTSPNRCSCPAPIWMRSSHPRRALTLGRFLADSVPFYIEFYERTRSYGGACMHDPLALALRSTR